MFFSSVLKKYLIMDILRCFYNREGVLYCWFNCGSWGLKISSLNMNWVLFWENGGNFILLFMVIIWVGLVGRFLSGLYRIGFVVWNLMI